MTTELHEYEIDTQPTLIVKREYQNSLAGVLNGPAGPALVVLTAQLLPIWSHVRLYYERDTSRLAP